MNRHLLKALILGGSALTVTFVMLQGATPPELDAPADDPRRIILTAPPPPEWTPPPPPPPPPVSAGVRPFLLHTAAQWRERAAADAEVQEKLGQWLLEAHVSSDVCETIALVLGSLGHPDADRILRRALAEGSGAPVGVVLAALGMEATVGDPFFCPEGSRAVTTPGGFRVRLRREIDDAGMRQALAGFLQDPDRELRHTAFLVLVGSIKHEDVREHFMRAGFDEPDPEIQYRELASLANWAAGAIADDPQKQRILGAMLDRAADPAAVGMRALLHDALLQAELSADERDRLRALAASDDADISLWARSILSE